MSESRIVLAMECGSGACVRVTPIVPGQALPTRCSHCGRAWTNAEYAQLCAATVAIVAVLTDWQGIREEIGALCQVAAQGYQPASEEWEWLAWMTQQKGEE